MAVTQEQVDALNQAIADGVRQVTIGGSTVTYNTTASLIAARDDLLAQLRDQQAKDAGVVRTRRTQLYYGGRGY